MAVALDSEIARRQAVVLRGRALMACGACGWVHYVMTAEEKWASDRALDRYHLTPAEQIHYESALRQCIRCEAPVEDFRSAEENDLARAGGHIVTPVLIDNG